MVKKAPQPRANKPARDKTGKFTSGGPALQAGSLDSQMAQETSELNTVTTQEVNPMSKTETTTPAVSTTGSIDLKALAAKGYTVVTTTVGDVAPAAVMDKMPPLVKTVAGSTPVSVLVSLALYGLYRKFFKKAPADKA